MGLVCLPTYKTHGCYGLQQCWRSNWILGWSCGIRFRSWDSLKSTCFLWCFKKTVKVFRFFSGSPNSPQNVSNTSSWWLNKQRLASWQRVVNRIQHSVANREFSVISVRIGNVFRCIANFRTSLLRLDLRSRSSRRRGGVSQWNTPSEKKSFSWGSWHDLEIQFPGKPFVPYFWGNSCWVLGVKLP